MPRGAAELGVEVLPFTRVTAIELGKGGIERVVSERGSIATRASWSTPAAPSVPGWLPWLA